MPSEVPFINLLGMPVSRVTRAEALSFIHEFIRSGQPHHVVTADASMHVAAAADPELRAIIAAAPLVTPDGAGLLWAAQRLGTPLPERVSGVDLSEQICADSVSGRYDVFFFGAAPGVAQEAAAEMRRRYPGARIVGARDGFQRRAEDEAALLAELRDKRPEVLLVALGIPKQEKWISRHQAELGIPVCIGVGGTFDVFSGRVQRAPVWMQKNGLEWLYRLLQNPKKYSKVATLPVFALRVLLRRGMPQA